MGKRKKKRSSLRRVLLVLLPAAAAVLGLAGYRIWNDTLAANRDTEILWLRQFGLDEPVDNRLSDRFNDADGNLVADAPTDEAKWVTPDRLVFSYVASIDAEQAKATWQPLVDHLESDTGLPVDHVVYDQTNQQLQALKDGSLHVAGLNTGSVPIAVNDGGFVPAFTLGDDGGQFGITTEFIVPAGSPIKTVADVKGAKITFTDKNSNSGFKAPVVILKHDFGLLPERDYEFGFSFSHTESIGGIAAGRYQVAPVASDLLAQMVEADDIQTSQYRSIFSSSRFPPAAFGYAHNLHPDLAAKIRTAFETFEFTDTPLEAEFAGSQASQFVPVEYKDDWALVKRIDDTLGYVHEIEEQRRSGGFQPPPR